MIPPRSPKESRVRQMGPSKSLHSALQCQEPPKWSSKHQFKTRTVVASSRATFPRALAGRGRRKPGGRH